MTTTNTDTSFKLPSPDEVRAEFDRLMAIDAEQAVGYLYDIECKCGYIKVKENARNLLWSGASPYGDLEISVNLAKPEKDPKAIAAALAKKKEAEADAAQAADAEAALVDGMPVPLCDLCFENEEFPGTPAHPPKPGLRVMHIELGGEPWGLQYSPYAYFEEHCIAQSKEHRPMVIDDSCFGRLMDFEDLFPFYFVGSNADLPIVGGSILSHDHYQGGRHVFPLMKSTVRETFDLPGFAGVQAGIANWPSSVVRLRSADRNELEAAAQHVLHVWKEFSEPACDVLAYSGDTPHNTLNPIFHKEGDDYVLDLVLRNNRTTEERPWGLFHPDESLHHIKKENIGLIEIMGLAILPGRLIRELPAVQDVIYAASLGEITDEEAEKRLLDDELTAKHAPWGLEVLATRRADLAAETKAAKEAPKVAVDDDRPQNPLGTVMRDEVVAIYARILEATGVFKDTPEGHEGWKHFIAAL